MACLIIIITIIIIIVIIIIITRFYPKYCSGAAYLITPSLVSSFLRASGSVPALWRDDVYMTGLVRDSLGVAPFYLNLRYTYEQVGRRQQAQQ